jgi:hypothetical protein
MAVTQNGTPNMSVNVAAGRAFVRAGNASSLAAGTYAVMNDATVNVAISAADPTNPRIDLVVVQVRDTNYGEAASDVRFFVIAGTPAAVPAVPALTSAPNCLVLAQVAVAAATSSIVTDKRMWATAKGGIIPIPTFTDAPTGAALEENTWIYERDAERVRVYDGTGWVIMAEPMQTYTVTGTNVTPGGGSASGSYHRSNGWVEVEIIQNFGATAPAMGTGPYWNLPVSAEATYPNTLFEGWATFYDASGSPYGGAVICRTAGTIEPRYVGANGVLTQWTAALPIAAANNDFVRIVARYRMTTRYS